jgi:tRNA wybutosine-synthesizing protein 3
MIRTGSHVLNWKVLEPEGTPPPPRYSHTMSLCEEFNFLVVFGGRIDFVTKKYGSSTVLNDVWLLHLDPVLMWVQVQCSGSIPRERFSHSACVVGTQLVIFGGLNAENF